MVVLGLVLFISRFDVGQAAQIVDSTGSPESTPAAAVTATLPDMALYTPPALCTDAHGQVLDFAFQSAIVQTSVAYRIYLPPCYWATDRRYPYVILLHGSYQDQTLWTDQLHINSTLDDGIRNGTLPSMILVMPNGGDLEEENVFTAGASFESLVLNELIPVIEQNFCTWNTQFAREIGGISRGGFWAYEIGFRYPTLFGAIGGHSAIFDPNNAPPANNPLNLAQTVQFPAGLQPRLWLDAGNSDVARPIIDDFAQLLTARQFNAAYMLYPTGEHTVDYWASHVADYLKFYGQIWPDDPGYLPRCH